MSLCSCLNHGERVKRGIDNRIKKINAQLKQVHKQIDAIDNNDDFDMGGHKNSGRQEQSAAPGGREEGQQARV